MDASRHNAESGSRRVWGVGARKSLSFLRLVFPSGRSEIELILRGTNDTTCVFVTGLPKV